MKLLLALCVALCFSGVFCDTAPTSEEPQYVKDCAAKNGLDAKAIADLKNSKSFNVNQGTMCFSHCVMKHNDMIDDEGKTTEKFKKIPKIAECQNLSGKDKCESAAKLMDCVFNKEGATLKDLNL